MIHNHTYGPCPDWCAGASQPADTRARSFAMLDSVHGDLWRARLNIQHERHAGIPDYGYCPGRGPRPDIRTITSADLARQRKELAR